MQKKSFTIAVPAAYATRLIGTQLTGWLLMVLLLLNAACGQAQVPGVTFSEPLIITKGGTYTGNYKSTNSVVPAVSIRTTEPVILQNCTLVGPGELIYADRTGTDLTVRECRGYGTTPTIDNKQKGEFLYMLRGKNLVMEHNYLEQTKGVTLDRWVGDGSASQTIRMRYNQVVNLDARTRNGSTNSGCFALFNTVQHLANVDISWNQVVSEPNKSSSGDIINLFSSSGTESSPIRIHDNYLQGSYPVVATSGDFSGSGFTTDGDGNTAATCTRFFRLDHNQFVSNCNGAINLPVGRNGEIDHNRVVMSAYLPNGSKLVAVYAGIYPSNFYRKLPREAFGDFSIHDNVVGYVSHGPNKPYPNRFDIADDNKSFNQQFNITFGNNTSLPNPITYQTEQNELVLWQQKLQENNVTPGLTSGTKPTIAAPAPAPEPAPEPTPAPAPAPAPGSGQKFFRAFNINGNATTIDGNSWNAGAGTGLRVSGASTFANQGVALTPAADASRAAMLRSSAYGNNVVLTASSVPNDSYLVYLHVWEDNDAETFNVLVNGKVAQASYNSGAAGHWDRLGPYPATATNGTLTVGTSGGTANVSGLELWTAGGSTATAPAPVPTPPTTEPTTTSFYRAINLNGSAATIDGNPWEGSSAPSYSANGSAYSLQSQGLAPSTDANRATMLRSCQYGNNLSFQLTNVPSGTYLVSAYVWEDNFSETYSLALNGQTVASNLKTGAAGAWAKVGPYPVTVSNGTIKLTGSGGTVNLSGVEVWQQASSASLASTLSSSAVAAHSAVATAPASLYPNPLGSGQSRVQVEATVAQAEQVVVQVLSHMGTLLRQATLNFPAGLSSQLLEVGDLAPGTYVVRFASGSLQGKTIGLLKSE
ncbi:hypothetical protein QMK33_18695 [Hymenobacter sp. H14-R3]|uniref:hypothetical protein n=1 Tax=Hymenobacter sp. H14-R3 TaxID=3046308 RepID=UPI0024BB70BB|nr:hypothetical protein [Hymenobacter sp. H14-R3]MDJ0367182.1 hypothetical protein [Hymenobacter sp. H14-R3]